MDTTMRKSNTAGDFPLDLWFEETQDNGRNGDGGNSREATLAPLFSRGLPVPIVPMERSQSPMIRTRRDFLTTAAGGVAAATLGAAPSSGAASGAEQVSSGAIEVRVTDAQRKFSPAPAISWRPASGVSDAIVLDPSRTFQPHLGIGGAFTDAACYMFSTLSPAARQQLFHEMFDPTEMGLSVGRICVGSSDYARNAYSFDDGEPDPQLARFSIEHDRAYILPMLREVRAVNREMWLLASPWSPPGWMKPNHSMLGGCMRQSSLPAYARYFLKFLQAYEAEGVTVNSITSQNEVDAEQNGNMPACVWPQEIEIEFVGRHLGPLLRKSGVSTKIWILDHNYDLWGRVCCCLDDPGVREYSNAVAWHGYGGKPEMMSKVHDAHPDTEMFWTEGGPDFTNPNYLTEWSTWGVTFTGILRNWSRCIIGWNLALDEKGKPNIGPFSCGGTVTINSQTQGITRSGHFWAMSHFSRSIRRGARRFGSQEGPAGIHHVAFENPNGKRALVITNPGAARPVQAQLAGGAAEVPLPADSIVTLLWS
jgi:glucosylceramidase